MKKLLTGNRAAQLLGLPSNCVAANLRIRPDRVVTLTTMSYFEESENSAITLVAKRFALVELPDDKING